MMQNKAKPCLATPPATPCSEARKGSAGQWSEGGDAAPSSADSTGVHAQVPGDVGKAGTGARNQRAQQGGTTQVPHEMQPQSCTPATSNRKPVSKNFNLQRLQNKIKYQNLTKPTQGCTLETGPRGPRRRACGRNAGTRKPQRASSVRSSFLISKLTWKDKGSRTIKITETRTRCVGARHRRPWRPAVDPPCTWPGWCRRK